MKSFQAVLMILTLEMMNEELRDKWQVSYHLSLTTYHLFYSDRIDLTIEGESGRIEAIKRTAAGR